MKKYILFILITLSNLTTLYAGKSTFETLNIVCSDFRKILLQINSNNLECSEDAIMDNTGGYVDIPEEWYYLKIDNSIYHLNGEVTHDYENKINRFNSYIDIEILYNIKNSESIKFIQKINLEKNSISNITTTNKFNISLDKNELEEEYLECQ